MKCSEANEKKERTGLSARWCLPLTTKAFDNVCDKEIDRYNRLLLHIDGTDTMRAPGKPVPGLSDHRKMTYEVVNSARIENKATAAPLLQLAADAMRRNAVRKQASDSLLSNFPLFKQERFLQEPRSDVQLTHGLLMSKASVNELLQSRVEGEREEVSGEISDWLASVRGLTNSEEELAGTEKRLHELTNDEDAARLGEQAVDSHTCDYSNLAISAHSRGKQIITAFHDQQRKLSRPVVVTHPKKTQTAISFAAHPSTTEVQPPLPSDSELPALGVDGGNMIADDDVMLQPLDSFDMESMLVGKNRHIMQLLTDREVNESRARSTAALMAGEIKLRDTLIARLRDMLMRLSTGIGFTADWGSSEADNRAAETLDVAKMMQDIRDELRGLTAEDKTRLSKQQQRIQELSVSLESSELGFRREKEQLLGRVRKVEQVRNELETELQERDEASAALRRTLQDQSDTIQELIEAEASHRQAKQILQDELDAAREENARQKSELEARPAKEATAERVAMEWEKLNAKQQEVGDLSEKLAVAKERAVIAEGNARESSRRERAASEKELAWQEARDLETARLRVDFSAIMLFVESVRIACISVNADQLRAAAWGQSNEALSALEAYLSRNDCPTMRKEVGRLRAIQYTAPPGSLAAELELKVEENAVLHEKLSCCNDQIAAFCKAISILCRAECDDGCSDGEPAVGNTARDIMGPELKLCYGLVASFRTRSLAAVGKVITNQGAALLESCEESIDGLRDALVDMSHCWKTALNSLRAQLSNRLTAAMSSISLPPESTTSPGLPAVGPSDELQEYPADHVDSPTSHALESTNTVSTILRGGNECQVLPATDVSGPDAVFLEPEGEAFDRDKTQDRPIVRFDSAASFDPSRQARGKRRFTSGGFERDVGKGARNTLSMRRLTAPDAAPTKSGCVSSPVALSVESSVRAGLKSEDEKIRRAVVKANAKRGLLRLWWREKETAMRNARKALRDAREVAADEGRDDNVLLLTRAEKLNENRHRRCTIRFAANTASTLKEEAGVLSAGLGELAERMANAVKSLTEERGEWKARALKGESEAVQMKRERDRMIRRKKSKDAGQRTGELATSQRARQRRKSSAASDDGGNASRRSSRSSAPSDSDTCQSFRLSPANSVRRRSTGLCFPSSPVHSKPASPSTSPRVSLSHPRSRRSDLSPKHLPSKKFAAERRLASETAECQTHPVRFFDAARADASAQTLPSDIEPGPESSEALEISRAHPSVDVEDACVQVEADLVHLRGCQESWEFEGIPAPSTMLSDSECQTDGIEILDVGYQSSARKDELDAACPTSHDTIEAACQARLDEVESQNAEGQAGERRAGEVIEVGCQTIREETADGWGELTSVRTQIECEASGGSLTPRGGSEQCGRPDEEKKDQAFRDNPAWVVEEPARVRQAQRFTPGDLVAITPMSPHARSYPATVSSVHALTGSVAVSLAGGILTKETLVARRLDPSPEPSLLKSASAKTSPAPYTAHLQPCILPASPRSPLRSTTNVVASVGWAMGGKRNFKATDLPKVSIPHQSHRTGKLLAIDVTKAMAEVVLSRHARPRSGKSGLRSGQVTTLNDVFAGSSTRAKAAQLASRSSHRPGRRVNRPLSAPLAASRERYLASLAYTAAALCLVAAALPCRARLTFSVPAPSR